MLRRAWAAEGVRRTTRSSQAMKARALLYGKLGRLDKFRSGRCLRSGQSFLAGLQAVRGNQAWPETFQKTHFDGQKRLCSSCHAREQLLIQ